MTGQDRNDDRGQFEQLDCSGVEPMTWVRAVIVGFAVVALMAGGAATVSHAGDARMEKAEFRGVQLGMTQKQALTQIESIAPGAFIGPLCTGNIGVGSYLNHDGLDWQIMAHIGDGHVREIKLFRFDRAGTESAERCAERFYRLMGEQRQKHPSTQWHKAMEESGRFSIKGRVQATLPNDTVIELSVERLDWDKARCMIELLISRPNL